MSECNFWDFLGKDNPNVQKYNDFDRRREVQGL